MPVSTAPPPSCPSREGCLQSVRAYTSKSPALHPIWKFTPGWPPACAVSVDAVDSAVLDAAAGGVRPLGLHGVGADDLGVADAQIADLPLVVLILEPVPTLSRDGIGDRFAELVRGDGGHGVEDDTAAGLATGAVGIRHHRIEDVAAGHVVIAAEHLARLVAAHDHRDARRREDEVERIGIGGGGLSASGPLAQH